MVDAIPTPEYHDHEYHDWLRQQHGRLEEEVKSECLRANGYMIWSITESKEATYPFCSNWKKLFNFNKEFRSADEDFMHYLKRIITWGVISKTTEQIYVTSKKISLGFEILDLVTETIEKDKQDLPFTMLSLSYQGWMKSELVPSGEQYRRPDFIQFPESFVHWEDILKDLYKKDK